MNPAIILVRPQMGENIGATARAMLNFGLTDLRLVTPRDGWPNPLAQKNASGALEKMPNVRVYDSVADSLADIHYSFATTVRMRDMVKDVYSPESATMEGKRRVKKNQNIAFVFGAERTGLENDEISQCHALLSIPTNPSFSSLNLSQAVLLMAYEWSKMLHHEETLAATHKEPATHEHIDGFIKRLNDDLENARFYRSEDLKPTMQRNIRNIFLRSDLTEQEVRTLHGILSSLRGNKMNEQR